MDSIYNMVNSLTPGSKKVILAIVWLLAFFFIVKPASAAMKDFGDKRFAPGFISLAAAIFIFVIPVIITVGLYTLGKKAGADINSKAAMVQLASMVPMLIAVKFDLKHRFMKSIKQN